MFSCFYFFSISISGITDARPLTLKRPAPDGDTPKEKRQRLASVMQKAAPKGVMFQIMKPCSYKPDEVVTVDPGHDLNVLEEVELLTSPPPPPTMQKLANQFLGQQVGQSNDSESAHVGNEMETARQFTASLPQLSDKDVECTNRLTCGQPDSLAWKEHRVGRITASAVHQVYTKVNTIINVNSKRSKDATPCVESCMRRKQQDLSHVPAVKYGLTTEPDAKRKYKKVFSKEHKVAKVKECGLFLHRKYQYLGASPDLLASCKCHGEGIVEIKCPFIQVKPGSGTPKYIQVVNDKYQLNRGQPYYTQIQMQLAVADKAWCDFFVYNVRGYIIERIHPDANFWGKVSANCQFFFENHLAPALLANATPEVPQVFEVLANEDDVGLPSDAGEAAEAQELQPSRSEATIDLPSVEEVENVQSSDEEVDETEEVKPSTSETLAAAVEGDKLELFQQSGNNDLDVEIVQEICEVESDEEERPVSPTFPKVHLKKPSSSVHAVDDTKAKTGKKHVQKVCLTIRGQVCVICDCLCKEVIKNQSWIDKWFACHECLKHVHFVCAGILDDEDEALDEEHLLCPKCH